MTGKRWRWKRTAAGAIALCVITGCGGEPEKAPPPPTLASLPAAPAAASPTGPQAAPPTTAPPAPVAQAPRAIPTVEVKEHADLVSFSNWRWKDAEQRQLAVEVKLPKGPIAFIRYDFNTADGYVASGFLPGSAFVAGEATQTAFFPPATGVAAGGKTIVPDVSQATRLTIYVDPLPTDAVPAGQPAWVGPHATACEQGSVPDCKTLAAAYRTGRSDEGAVKADETLATHYRNRFVALGQTTCALGATETCFLLGLALVGGDDAPKDPDRGVAFVQKACGMGLQAACDWQVANLDAIQALAE
ncbi:MAG TPA: hypothetical protein VNO26_15705 [Candidatus Limnocylindria bacterium]|nr:hypothetical protein [Candidatus Limnocylindria bacterium]